MNYASTMIDLVGRTPLVKINHVINSPALILGKLEFFNPAGSVKDRIGAHMICRAIEEGKVNQDTIIIEPTSGNTGVALAWVCASKGLKLILTMPQSMSQERRSLLHALGAELYLTEAHLGMTGAIEKANELANQYENVFQPQQFSNPFNPEAHYLNTAREIWNDTDGKVTHFVAGVGTGGTLSGVGSYLKEQNSEIQIIAVEPEGSPVISGGEAGPHMLQGIGAGFVPDNLDRSLIDKIITVSNESGKEMSCRLAREEGIFCGISSGANVWATAQVAQKTQENDLIVTVICDLGDRYFSMGLFDE